ncbi:hypothetical protein LPY66_13175 [Dehalobacter sp. DCM]|nr:hypothetical protein LPY66_13175 [Dehalobacter sp. DCM]
MKAHEKGVIETILADIGLESLYAVDNANEQKNKPERVVITPTTGANT